MLYAGQIKNSYFIFRTDIIWNIIIIVIICTKQKPKIPSASFLYLHRSTLPQHHLHCFHQYPHIQRRLPLRYILPIQLHDFLKIRNLTSPAHLPHAGNTRLYAQPGAVVQVVLLPLIHRRRPGAYQAHVTLQHIPKLREFINGVFPDKVPNPICAPNNPGVILYLEHHTALYAVLIH